MVRTPLGICIVGGGFSGTLVAVHLLRLARTPLTVRLVERRPSSGPGLAFGSAHAGHLLNVRARNMSAFPEEPGHFVAWLRARSGPKTDGDSFVPRRVYGEYLIQLLDEAGDRAGGALQRVTGEAIGIEIGPGAAAIRVRLRSGDLLECDRAVLALGNFPSAEPPAGGTSLRDDARYVDDPWAPAALANIGVSTPVLIIGTGLTAIDAVLTLETWGHRAPIHALSRRGLLPEIHAPVPAWPVFPHQGPPRVLEWFRAVRAEVRAAEAEGAGWRAVIDSLRPRTQELWLSLPAAEQRRFLRHLRSLWDVHRHRMAPEVGERVARLRASGRLLVHAARIERYDTSDARLLAVHIRPRGSAESDVLRVGCIVNCTGPELDYSRIRHPLVRSLLDAGLARPDEHSLGLDGTPEGRLVGADARASDRLFTLGPPLRGRLWETTAVPDIREHAARLARTLLEEA